MNLPTALTLARIGAVPIVFLAYFGGGESARWIAAAVFVAAGATDFLDGYLARRMGRASALGRMLDSIADKVLITAIMMMLAAGGDIAGWTLLPALLILCRELVVSGLREFLAESGTTLKVQGLARWKTTVQIAAITLMIAGDPGASTPYVHLAGVVALWVAAGFTLASGYRYLARGLSVIAGGEAAAGRGRVL